jgi:predicted acylesterase/phospholipase RssA
MTIKHLVLSSGGIWGLSCYGALREAEKAGFWRLTDIESIYGTSAGAILGAILALGYSWDWIDDYLIKRPWHQVFKLDLSSLFSVYQTRGLLTKQCMIDIFTPLLLGKDLTSDVTLREFFEVTRIEFHCFSTEINSGDKLTSVDISHLTHPDWRLVDAVYCSACLPVLFTPVLHGNQCFIDGGITNHFPIEACSTGRPLSEIFGINKTYGVADQSPTIGENSTIFEYLFSLILKVSKAAEEPQQVVIPYQLDIELSTTSIADVFNVTSLQEERVKLIEHGVNAWTVSASATVGRWRRPAELQGSL